jgi:UDP-N-acetyl-D-mannosaminuronic acid dehydrogenase
VSVFGIAYKGNVGDWRESPALKIIANLQQKGVEVAVHDPLVLDRMRGFELVDAATAVKDSDLLVVLADHEIFKTTLEDSLLASMRRPLVLDTKNFVRLPERSVAGLINFNHLFSSVRTHSS